MGIAPAGIQFANTGHHHLLVDLGAAAGHECRAAGHRQHPPLRRRADAKRSSKLPPGKHTLQLVFADYLHIPHDKPIVSEKITITVK